MDPVDLVNIEIKPLVPRGSSTRFGRLVLAV
jgi:hypothetical protein